MGKNDMNEVPEIPSRPVSKPGSRWGIFLFLILVAGVYVAFSMPRGSAVQWVTDYEAGLQQASQSNRPVLLVFKAHWCGICKKMDADTFSRSKVGQALEEWVPIKIDVDDHPEIKASYNISALPTLVILSPQGQIIKRTEGAMPPEEFIRFLESAKQAIAGLGKLVSACPCPLSIKNIPAISYISTF